MTRHADDVVSVSLDKTGWPSRLNLTTIDAFTGAHLSVCYHDCLMRFEIMYVPFCRVRKGL